MELDKLHIHNPASRIIGYGQAIADCCLWICSACIDCRRTARSEKDVVGHQQHLATILACARRQLLIFAPAPHAIASAVTN